MNGELSRGAKVLLRPKRLDDAEDDYRWRADEELATLDATTPIRMSFREFLVLYEDEFRYRSSTVHRYAIDTLGGQHIGNCMCYDVDLVMGEAEVGIMVGDRDYWSLGFGSDAMAQLVGLTFMDPSLSRIYLHTLEWNARARKAFAKCGFREVRPVQRGGRSFVYMELYRHEWEAIREQVLGVDTKEDFLNEDRGLAR